MKEQYNRYLSTVASIDPQVNKLLNPVYDMVTFSNIDTVLDILRIRAKALETYVGSTLMSFFFQMLPALSSMGLTQKTTPFSGFTEITPVLEKLGLTPNWLLAATSLSLFELAVNRALTQMKIDLSGDYNERVEKLAHSLRQKGFPFPETMVSALRGARNMVLKEGKDPTQYELSDIIKYLRIVSERIN